MWETRDEGGHDKIKRLGARVHRRNCVVETGETSDPHTHRVQADHRAFAVHARDGARAPLAAAAALPGIDTALHQHLHARAGPELRASGRDRAGHLGLGLVLALPRAILCVQRGWGKRVRSRSSPREFEPG